MIKNRNCSNYIAGGNMIRKKIGGYSDSWNDYREESKQYHDDTQKLGMREKHE